MCLLLKILRFIFPKMLLYCVANFIVVLHITKVYLNFVSCFKVNERV